MKVFAYIFLLLTMCQAFAQNVDSLYIAPYPQRISVSPFVANNTLMVSNNDIDYSPNNPITVGVGFAIKNTVINARASFGVADLMGKEYGKTKIVDFQLHNYGRKFIVDVFIQNYKGFYNDDSNNITLYPDMAVRQIGAEGTYLFNGRQFSAKAAFQQSERQLQSAGSFAIGGGLYAYRLHLGDALPESDADYIDNIQFGANAGYAYSWVANKYWLLSGMVTVGANVGNNPDALKNVKLNVYPTAFARGSAAYSKNDWSAAFSMLIQNKQVYATQGNEFSVTSLGVQLMYVKRFDRFR
jgi:hypothetical protein